MQFLLELVVVFLVRGSNILNIQKGIPRESSGEPLDMRYLEAASQCCAKWLPLSDIISLQMSLM